MKYTETYPTWPGLPPNIVRRVVSGIKSGAVGGKYGLSTLPGIVGTLKHVPAAQDLSRFILANHQTFPTQ